MTHRFNPWTDKPQTHLEREAPVSEPVNFWGRRMRPVCKVTACDLNELAKGYCSKHYQRVQRYGDPTVCKIARADNRD